MKERDYIDVADLTRIRTMRDLLREIVPDNSARAIPEADYATVYSIFSKWEAALTKRVKT